MSRAQKKNTRDGEPNELQNHNDQEMCSDDSPGSGGGCTIEEQLHDDTNIVPETELEQMETSEDSCDGDEDSAVASSFREQLKEWAIDFGEKHNAVDALLKVLKKNGHPELPSTARTLLESTNEVDVETESGMQCVQFDVRGQILEHLKKYPQAVLEKLDSVDISLNVDGLPLFKSNNQSLWPVLCCINLSPKSIFPLSLALVSSKPTSLNFISETVSKLENVMQNGLEWGDKVIRVQIRCITCDAPAKALVKCIKQYSGYFGCDRCTQKGFWDGRMTYQEVENLTLRTDQSFREVTQLEHHHEGKTSPFSNLSIDMVTSFPVDYMHQCCLGVMKKLLLLWTKGKKETRMSSGQIKEVSVRLEQLKTAIPNNFARKPRGLEHLERWKATEFRQFALYTGKVVLRGVLQDDLFEHFMAFSVAMCMLISPSLVQAHCSYAHELLSFFVQQGRFLYGECFLVYNVHSMLHLAADAKKFGCLDNCSAFPFENYLHHLKKLVRSGRSPLVQIVKRLNEGGSLRRELTEKEGKVSSKHPNNIYMLNDKACCEVLSTTPEKNDGAQMFLCWVYNHLEPYTSSPCDSRLYGAIRSNIRNTSMKLISEICLTQRAIMFEEEYGSRVFFTILHSFS